MTRKIETAKVILSDAEFLRRLQELEGNFSALGREIGVSHTAVRKRFARLKKGARKQGNAAGQTAAVALLQESRQGFPEGVAEAIKKVGTLDRLENLFKSLERQVNALDEFLREEEARGKNRSIKPHWNKALVTLIREARGLLTDSFAIKKDLYSIKSTQIFIDVEGHAN